MTQFSSLLYVCGCINCLKNTQHTQQHHQDDESLFFLIVCLMNNLHYKFFLSPAHFLMNIISHSLCCSLMSRYILRKNTYGSYKVNLTFNNCWLLIFSSSFYSVYLDENKQVLSIDRSSSRYRYIMFITFISLMKMASKKCTRNLYIMRIRI